METNSTQAVEADTTSNPTPVKRWKRGDVREDGMVFWCYGQRYVNGEYWTTLEEFATKKTKEAECQRRHQKSPKRRTYLQEYYREHKDKYRARSNKWRHDNPERTRASGRKSMRKLRANPVSAYALRVRNLIFCALERKGFWKTGRTEEIVGCSWLGFSAYLESHFLDGMSHDNRHLWHIDHIVPVSLARDVEEVNILNHHTNLRPLWGPENLSKGKKLPAEHELPANLHPKVREIWQRAKDSACTK